MSPEEAHRRAGRGRGVIGWSLDRDAREALLRRFPPRFERVVADHVTLTARVSADAALPGPVAAEIVGRSEDGEGVEAMVVRIEESTARPDGSTYHITWSLGEGRQARESNDVIAAKGWTAIDLPVPVPLTPARLR